MSPQTPKLFSVAKQFKPSLTLEQSSDELSELAAPIQTLTFLGSKNVDLVNDLIPSNVTI